MNSMWGSLPHSGQTSNCPAARTRAIQAAEKRFPAVILSEAKNLALRIFMNIRDSSSPAAPQNDSAYEFFRSLLSR